MSTARRILEELASAGVHSQRPGYRLRRAISNSPLNLYLGRESPSGLPALLLQVKADIGLGDLDRISTRAVHIVKEHLPDDPPDQQSIVVKLSEPGLLDEYCAVVDQLFQALQNIQSDVHAVAILSARLRAWLLLFSPDHRLMSEERQRGLFGELSVLEILGNSSGGWPLALRSWTGIDRKDRDFKVENVFIEVKTNLAGNRDSVRVSNEFQLDSGAGISLLLWVLTLEEDSKNGSTLPNRMTAVRTILGSDPDCLVKFEDSVLKAGYSDLQIARITPQAYKVVSHRIFLVTENFPRIVSSDLLQGVQHVSYDVDLRCCSACLKGKAEIAALLPIQHPSED